MKCEMNAFDALERIFHEPNRLAILTALSAADQGLTFTELKTTCGLTDGNLNRHLKVLEDAGVVEVEKGFVGVKPRTTVTLTRRGLEGFQHYLAALAEVLKAARKSVPAPARRPALAGA